MLETRAVTAGNRESADLEKRAMRRISVTKNSVVDRRPLRAASMLVLGASMTLSACSFVPDWGNPVVWYDSVVEGFGGTGNAPPKADSEAVQRAQAQSAPDSGDTRSFPQLKTVPQQAPQASSNEERRQVAQGLVADRDNARYTDQVLRAGGTPKPAAPSMQVARVAPPPPPPAQVPQTSQTTQSVQTPKPSPAPAPMARLPKLDLSPAPRPQVAAVSPPPQSAVPQSQAVSPAPTPRPIVEPERGAQPAVPYPPLTGTVPSRVASGGPSSIVQSSDSAAPAAAQAAPQPVPTVTAMAPSQPAVQPVPQPVTQAPTLSSVGAEQGALAQAFANALAQSASTVTTAPASTAFGAPSATPLSPSETSVPDIVRETYNQTLIAGSGVAPAPTAASGASLAAVPAGPATVLFGNGSSSLNRKAKAVIRDIAETYKTRRGSLRIVGHASHRTRNLPVQRHKLVNFQISLDRATAVANELIRLGVDKSAIQIAAVSDSQPVFYESMPEGEAGNRRAEIFYTF